MATSISGNCCGHCTIKGTQRNKDYDYLFKLLLVGNAGVGKTSLLVRFVDDAFATYISGIGVDFRIKTVELDEKKIKLQIWDTVGGMRFQTIARYHYRSTHGVLVIYDVTNYASFEGLSKCLDGINIDGDEMQTIVVGNKCDLQDQRQVSIETAQALANGMGIPYVETSAKTNVNVEQTFLTLTALVKEHFDRDMYNDIYNTVNLSGSSR